MQMSHEIRIEATRIAKKMVEDCIRASGCRICDFKASEIMTAAKKVLKRMPEEIIPVAWDICKMRWEAAKLWRRSDVLVRGSD